MARILLAPMPFTGHVIPVLAVARELVERGHDVRVYTGSAFRNRVEAAGVRFVPWRAAPDFDENDLPATFSRLVGKKGLAQLLVNVADLFIGTSSAQVDDLTAEWRREPWEVIAGDEVSIGAAFFAEKYGRPWATIAILPLNMRTADGPPSGMGLVPGRHPITRARDAVLRRLVPLLSRPLAKPIARARASIGLPPSRRTMDEFAFSPQLVVASGVRALDYGRTGQPASLHFVGQLRAPTSAGEVPQWWPDLDGRTVVHVTQGTQNIDPADLIRPALEALASEDVLVVVTTGVPGRDELPFPVPANARVAGFLPYDVLLPRVDVAITNGGWGGTLAALAHGIPLVIAGGDLDKPEVAARVAWTGAGVNLRTGRPSAAAVRRGFERVRSDPAYRAAAERVAAELATAGGARRAAELIEGLLADG